MYMCCEDNKINHKPEHITSDRGQTEIQLNKVRETPSVQ